MQRLTTLFPLFLFGNALLAGNGPAFTENKGQWPDRVVFRALFAQHSVFVERDGFTVLTWSDAIFHHHDGTDEVALSQPRAHAYRVRFIGASRAVASGHDALSDVENYFIGRNSRSWGTNARRFGSIGLDRLYPGVDLRASAQGHFKYELVVQPGVRTDDIVLQYEGHEALRLEHGSLHISTSVGTMIEEAPVAYQEREGARVPVRCAFVLDGDRLQYAFPDGYDATRPLVIDPSLVFASYSGSSAGNFAFCATYDTGGHLYAGSTALGVGYPTSLGSYQPSFNGGYADMALSKFIPDGSALVWSTYIGGMGNEYPVSMAVNSNDELYLLATIGSVDFPVTPNAFDTVFHGGPAVPMIGIGSNYFPDGCDMAVLRLSASGNVLLGSTLFGGTGTDGAGTATILKHNYNDQARGELILDTNGLPVIASMTTSTDLPTTADAPQPINGGAQDGCLMRFSPALDQLLLATYIGGTADDAAYGLCANSDGEVIVVGGTDSGDLPMSGTPFNATYSGAADGFVMRYSPSGDQLLTSTFLGTGAYDQAFLVDVDALDAVVVLGQSVGAYTVTPGSYNVPNSANFLQKLTPDLSSAEWSTVFGNGTGTTDISPVAFNIDYSGRMLIARFGAAIPGGVLGTTNGLPITADAFQVTTDGNDFYIAALSADATALVYASYLGGATSYEHNEGGTSRFNENGDLFLAVCSGCGGDSDFPVTMGSWSTTNNGSPCNLVAVKFGMDGTMNVAPILADQEAIVRPTLVDEIMNVVGCTGRSCSLTIMDATGRLVHRIAVGPGGALVRTDTYAPGTYTLELYDGMERRQARFVVPAR